MITCQFEHVVEKIPYAKSNRRDHHVAFYTLDDKNKRHLASFSDAMSKSMAIEEKKRLDTQLYTDYLRELLPPGSKVWYRKRAKELITFFIPVQQDFIVLDKYIEVLLQGHPMREFIGDNGTRQSALKVLSYYNASGVIGELGRVLHGSSTSLRTMESPV